jgi:hypothetical protein
LTGSRCGFSGGAAAADAEPLAAATSREVPETPEEGPSVDCGWRGVAGVGFSVAFELCAVIFCAAADACRRDVVFMTGGSAAFSMGGGAAPALDGLAAGVAPTTTTAGWGSGAGPALKAGTGLTKSSARVADERFVPPSGLPPAFGVPPKRVDGDRAGVGVKGGVSGGRGCVVPLAPSLPLLTLSGKGAGCWTLGADTLRGNSCCRGGSDPSSCP